jgi:hypothetical protein
VVYFMILKGSQNVCIGHAQSAARENNFSQIWYNFADPVTVNPDRNMKNVVHS